MKSPIEEARKKLDLTIKELAFVTELAENTIRWNLRGDNVEITSKLLSFLSDQGFDKDQLQADYKRFRESKKHQLLRVLKAKRA
ncbi:hypothetical protein [Peribacillus frigoritolerans]|uniref:hypothetical protein n=1 Tax=Peribacillus frigoritolerans TaxID=450367 RepID=UPI003F7EB809